MSAAEIARAFGGRKTGGGWIHLATVDGRRLPPPLVSGGKDQETSLWLAYTLAFAQWGGRQDRG